jgi:hypothetical protein
VRTTSDLPPRAAIDITVWRDGAERKLQAKLIVKPPDATPAAAPPATPPPGKKSESDAPPAPGASPQSSYEQFTDLARQQAEKAGAAKPPWIERAEVLWVGIYTSTPIKVIKDPSLATNQRLEADQMTNIQETTTITLKDEIWFGLDARLVGSPDGVNVPVPVEWRYPSPGIRSADGAQKLPRFVCGQHAARRLRVLRLSHR